MALIFKGLGIDSAECRLVSSEINDCPVKCLDVGSHCLLNRRFRGFRGSIVCLVLVETAWLIQDAWMLSRRQVNWQ